MRRDGPRPTPVRPSVLRDTPLRRGRPSSTLSTVGRVAAVRSHYATGVEAAFAGTRRGPSASLAHRRVLSSRTGPLIMLRIHETVDHPTMNYLDIRSAMSPCSRSLDGRSHCWATRWSGPRRSPVGLDRALRLSHSARRTVRVRPPRLPVQPVHRLLSGAVRTHTARRVWLGRPCRVGRRRVRIPTARSLLEIGGFRLELTFDWDAWSSCRRRCWRRRT